jgi:type III pantothenate kinase
MILVADIGNSAIKCGVVDAGLRVFARDVIETYRGGDALALSDLIKRVSTSVLSIERSIVCSVVPSVTPAMTAAIGRQLGTPPQIVSHEMRLPFSLSVPIPSQIGTDRFCAAAGAVGLKGRSAIVIDAGSAITVDVVREGAYLGGMILAGPALALRALHQYASQLPAIDYERLEEAFPDTFDTTQHAMILGASIGCVGAIREAVKHLELSAGRTTRKFITGGFGGVLAPRLPQSWEFDRDLTLKGLRVIAHLNRRKSD